MCLVLQQRVYGFPALNLPDVCTKSPGRGKAFCNEHCALLENEAPDVPHDLRAFLKYCGAKGTSTGMAILTCNCLGLIACISM